MRIKILFSLVILSLHTLALGATDQEIDQFVHRYLNDDLNNNQHCHNGYCYFDTSRGNIDVYWRNYGDEEYEDNKRNIIYDSLMNNNHQIKIEINRAQAIVKALLRQHLDLFDYLSDITTGPELLPYLEKYETLKMRFTSKPLSPDLKIILVGDQHISSHFIGRRAAGVARCDFLEGIVLINANSWNSCIKHDDVFSEFLIFHEIAHCDLKRSHGDDGENNVLSFVDRLLMEHSFNQALNGPIESCRSIDALSIFQEEYEEWPDRPSFGRNYIEDNFEQLYTELFSKDKFYDYDESHYEDDHDSYTEVEDLSEFTTVVNNDLIAIKQKLQRLARDQQQNL